MARRCFMSPFDQGADERLTFADATLLAPLAVSAVALVIVVLPGTPSALHRIAAVLGRA